MELQGQLTQRGEALLAQALSGQTLLTVTRAASGSGQTARSAAALAQERQALGLGTAYTSTEGAVLPVTLVEAQAEAAYDLTEVGVYVRDGAGESLYAVYRMTPALPVDPASALTVCFLLEECFGESAEVSVTPAGTMTRADWELLRNAPGGFAGLDGDGALDPAQMPYTCGTEALEPGVSPLPSGKLHFVYA